MFTATESNSAIFYVGAAKLSKLRLADLKTSYYVHCVWSWYGHSVKSPISWSLHLTLPHHFEALRLFGFPLRSRKGSTSSLSLRQVFILLILAAASTTSQLPNNIQNLLHSATDHASLLLTHFKVRDTATMLTIIYKDSSVLSYLCENLSILTEVSPLLLELVL